jgi:acyl-CoA thioester hydrolase
MGQNNEGLYHQRRRANPQSLTPNPHLIRVRYAETDQAGMAHHSAYLPWFEEGRVELLRSLGKPYQEIEAEDIHFPVREAFCRYWAPARFDDVLIVATTIEEVGGASVRFCYRITRQADGVLIAEGHTLHACVNDNGKVKRLPPEIRKLLSS